MKLLELLPMLERIAPKALAEEWDNPGLLIEPAGDEITRILAALDCTEAVAKEAEEAGAQLVLTHHPLFFKPVRRIWRSDPDTAPAYRLIQSGIGLYAAHTNLDSALSGVNDALAKTLGLTDVRALFAPELPLSPETQGIGRVGLLPRVTTLYAFARDVRERLGAAVRFGGDPEAAVLRVAVVGGSGGEYVTQAHAARADVLVTGEIRHHEALRAAALGIGVVEAGHYETERVVLAPWIAGLQAALEEIQYKADLLTAQSERAPLMAP